MVYRTWGGHLIGALVLTAASVCEAQVPKTFVGVNGNDGNDCLSATTACRTINGAIAKVDAEGEVIVTSTGSYAGANITKSVRVNAPSGIVAFAAQPITVNAPGATVAIRGFTMKAVTPGTGTGLNVVSVGILLLERVVIDGWSTGLQLGAANASVSISDSIFRNNTGTAGLDVSAVSKVAILKSRFERNIRGVTVSAAATVSLARSSAVGNTNSGFSLSVAGGFVGIDRAMIINNGLDGGVLASAGVMRLSNSSITGNGKGVAVSGGVVESFSNSAIRGNTTDIVGALTPVLLQ